MTDRQYSVSPRRTRRSGAEADGEALDPDARRLATKKCPSSWMRISVPRPRPDHDVVERPAQQHAADASRRRGALRPCRPASGHGPSASRGCPSAERRSRRDAPRAASVVRRTAPSTATMRRGRPRRRRHARQGVADQPGNLHEAAPAREERGHRHLVGRVQHHRRRPAGPARLAGQAQARERRRVGRLEGQAPEPDADRAGRRAGQPLRDTSARRGSGCPCRARRAGR